MNGGAASMTRSNGISRLRSGAWSPSVTGFSNGHANTGITSRYARGTTLAGSSRFAGNSAYHAGIPYSGGGHWNYHGHGYGWYGHGHGCWGCGYGYGYGYGGWWFGFGFGYGYGLGWPYYWSPYWYGSYWGYPGYPYYPYYPYWGYGYYDPWWGWPYSYFGPTSLNLYWN